jgi:hypothetical protein
MGWNDINGYGVFLDVIVLSDIISIARSMSIIRPSTISGSDME